MIGYIWSSIKKAWPPNRVVTMLTPLVFMPLAGWIATQVAQHFPGLPAIDSEWLTGVFVVGALGALTTAYSWLDGWKKYEAQLAHPDMKPVLAPSHKTPPAEIKEGGETLPPGGDPRPNRPDPGDWLGDELDLHEDYVPELDDEERLELSLPDDIAESDADDPDAPERRERIPAVE